MVDVIEISGSEEDDNVRTKHVVVSRRRRTSSLSAISSTSHRIPSYRGDINGVESDVDLHSHNRRPKPGTERARVRRIIQSSSSSSEGEGRVFNQAGGTPRIRHPGVADVIEISDSDDEVEDVLGGREPPFGRCRPPPPPPQALPPFDEEHEQTETDDDGLLILNEPKSARRPLPRLHRPQTARTTVASPPDRLGHSGEKEEDAHGLVQAFSTLSSLTALTDSDSENNARSGATADPTASSTASPTHLLLPPSANVLTVPATPKTPRHAASAKPKYTPAKTPRTSKKALAQAEQAERAAYAQSLFDELNRTVFAGGLPAETSLVWSNRLLTTAGRARWHRSKEGVHTTLIELATKILDSKERIRNTLSHEMCHLACWIINQDPKEGHGKAWKSWAAKVMRKRADIDISTRHNYEISYPYEWECENCAKTYGRFSRSIRPDEVVCGACKTGTLHPLFTVRPKKTTVNSRMAATSPRDSPRAAVVPVDSGTGAKMPGAFGHDDDELDELIQKINRLGVD